MTLEGTNTYVVGRDPAIVIDPGPDDEGHIEAVRAAAEARGGIAAVLLTHGHADHTDGVGRLGIEPTRLADGETEGPLAALATPGHAPDHLCFVTEQTPSRLRRRSRGGGVGFCGDLILGWGSAIVPSRQHGGSLADYMASLERLAALDLELLYPGHGPEITDPCSKINEYVAHRLERERKLVAALERGERSRAQLLDAAWDDVPGELRGAAAIAMQAHLEKLDDEGRLPPDLTD
jgi:glyoxylase-like metal-dependent hydrolase (beta-lactamase superfamily II)